MIWQLLKRDPAWRWLAPTTFGVGVLAVFVHFLNVHDGAAAGMQGVTFVQLFAVGIAVITQESETRFQASLPVSVHRIFAVRMLSVFVLLWLPVAAGAAVFIALGDAGFSGLQLRVWSVVTCAVWGVQCAGIQGQRRPALLAFMTLPVWFVIALLPVGFDPARFFRNPVAGTLVSGCCCLAVITLIVRTWRRSPPSFQLPSAAPLPATPAPVTAQRARRTGMPWRAILRVLFPMMGFEYLITFLAMCVFHSPHFAVLVAGNLTSARVDLRWMSALPVRPQALLLAIILPDVLSLECGYLIGIRLPLLLTSFPRLGHYDGIRTQIVFVVFIAACSILANLAMLAGDWQRVRRVLPAANWSGIFGLLFKAAAIGLMVWQVTATHLDPVDWLSSVLPSGAAFTFVFGVLTLAVLWQALCAMFRQVEFVGKPARGGLWSGN